MATIADSLFIKDIIRCVNQELSESQRERETKGEPILFEVEKMTIEVNFIVTEAKGGKGGFDFKILTAGGEANFQNQQIHKITLDLIVPHKPKKSKNKSNDKGRYVSRFSYGNSIGGGGYGGHPQ